MNDFKNKTIVLDLHYLAPVIYYSTIITFQKVFIAKCEHYEKSTYRNRCYIASPNGTLRLTVPLLRGKNQHIIVKDVRISYDYNWQKLHWESLCACYRSSPYFEFYEDNFVKFYLKRYNYLFDFNEELMNLILNILKIKINYSYTECYIKSDENSLNLRSAIHPKQSKNKITLLQDTPSYHQVFENKTGFFPDLSIVDLLFNEGPATKEYLYNLFGYLHFNL